MRKFTRSILRLLSIGAVVALGLSYLSAYVSPEDFWPLYFVGLAYPWLLLTNFIFLLIWCFFKKWYALLPLLCILLGWGHLTTFVGVNPSNGEGKLRVMTYNVGLKKQMKYKERTVLMDKIKAVYLDAKNDVVCLQEITPVDKYYASTLEEAKRKGFQYYHRIANTSLTILSKFPIQKSGALSFHGRANGGIYADVKVKGKTLRVYNLHLASNSVTTSTNSLIKEGDLQKKSTWAEITGVLRKVKRTSIVRAGLLGEINKHIGLAPYPIIICGDFNDTPQSYTYQQIKNNKQAAFRAGGFGIGSTYAGAIPALKIDHILVDESLDVVDAEVIHTDLGDHYPLVAEIDW